VILLPLAAIIAYSTRFNYFDRHVWELSPVEVVISRKLVMVIEAIYLLVACFTKTSILLFYRRMSIGALSPVFHWLVRLAILSVVLSTVAYELALFLSCRPLNAFWNQVSIPWIETHQEGKDYVCFNESLDYLSATAVSMVQDFMACLLPLVLFRAVQMPVRQKLALSGVFFVGFL
jgi:hypothetical protein